MVVTRAMKLLHQVGIELVRTYHRLEVVTPETVVDEPVLFVANHGFGGIVDLNVFATYAAFQHLGLTRPVTALTHQIAWTIGVGRFIEPLGARPAARNAAEAAFARGEHVLVLPGGDVDAGKSFSDRHQITFSGRHGFAKLAVDAGVPIVPVVTAGAGESLYVLSDGQGLARVLRLNALLRIKALPVSLSAPWGLSVGAVGLIPYLPMPTKLHTVVLEPMHPGESESPAEFGERVELAMQTAMDAMTAERVPVLG